MGKEKETTGKSAGSFGRPPVGVGYRVGKLTVAAATGERKNGYIVWKCRCDCGGEILLDTCCLQRGTVTDCGCASRVKPGQRDIAGMRFGSLTVTAYAGKRNGMHQWRCVCDCGNETVVGQTLLQTGKTKSCGCLQSEIYRENLKLVDGTSVTILEAGKNRLIASNTSGYTGVYLNKRNGRWVAQITFKGKTRYLRAYERKREAIKARQRAEEEIFEPFLREFAEGAWQQAAEG